MGLVPELELTTVIFAKRKPNKAYMLARIPRLSAEVAKYYHRYVREWLEAMRKKIMGDFNENILKDRAGDFIDGKIEWEWIEAEGMRILKNPSLKVLEQGGNLGFKICTVQETFDALNVKSLRFVESSVAKLVREVTDETKKAIKAMVRDKLAQNKTWATVGREIRPLVGLTEYQTKVIANFEEKLILDRPDLSANEIRRRVATYEGRMHRRRCDIISRTESHREFSEGMVQAYSNTGVRELEYVNFEHPCPECEALHGKKYSVEEASGVIPRHPNCNCCFYPSV